MGVPAFYKWLVSKYPKVVSDCVEDRPGWTDSGVQIPVDTSHPNPNGVEFDNLFLDMNGIIHPASHPEDRPPPETEDDMNLAVTDYLERVFAAARPRKLLFMAIDGVAPRAKMNQQRARRFRSAQEAAEKEAEENKLRAEWEAEGRELPPKKEGGAFDSNVITPGTPFMDKLAAHLRAFIHLKLTTDPGWKGIKVILSDGSVPGEGEHKIMEYIRQQRLQPGYDANTRHALHGLDADLIMLSLATHEPHFAILREFVGAALGGAGGPQTLSEKVEAEMQQALLDATTGGTKHPDTVGGPPTAKGPTPFQWLHVNILREYLNKEFEPPSSGVDYGAVAGGWSLERLIDDFIFLCFFVGNDFLPHLPSLDIRNGAIDTLCDLYKAMLPRMGGWISDGGKVDLGRALLFCRELGTLEDELLTRTRAGDERYKDKQRRRSNELQSKALGGRHAAMMRRVAEYAVAPQGQAAHVMAMRGCGTAADADAASRRAALGHDDAALLALFDDIATYASAPDCAPPKKMPSGLNGFQRAMVHQYCEELGVREETRGIEPNRAIWLIKIGEGANESAAEKFKRELSEIVKEKNTAPEQEDQLRLGLPGWKERYYSAKFPGVDALGRRDVASAYVEGLQWVMGYYYDGCPSWKWFYPYHYAPFAADLAEAIQPDQPACFDIAKPFAPFQQLMGVLPPRSAHALPAPLAALMTDPASEISDFYPEDFALDLNGKKFLWQAVVLLPFIDEARLTEAMGEALRKLSQEEKRRNAQGVPVLCVSQAHPLCAPMVAAYGPPLAPLVLTSCEDHGGGVAGTLTPSLPLPGMTCEPPPFHGIDTARALRPFTTAAAGAAFALPPNVKHAPSLLPGLSMPPPVLSDFDAPQPNHRFVRARRDGGRGNGQGHGYSRHPSDRAPLADARVIHELLSCRASARASRDFPRADAARAQLLARGIEVDDRDRSWMVRDARLAMAPGQMMQQGGPFGMGGPRGPAAMSAPGATSAPPLHLQPACQQPHMVAAYTQHRHAPPPHRLPPASLGIPPPYVAPAPYPQLGLVGACGPHGAAPGTYRGGYGGGYGGAPGGYGAPGYGAGSGGGGPIRHERFDTRHHPYAPPPTGLGGFVPPPTGLGGLGPPPAGLGGYGPPPTGIGGFGPPPAGLGGFGGAAGLLRQQLAAAPPPRPPPMPGATADANRSAAELLRQQLMRK